MSKKKIFWIAGVLILLALGWWGYGMYQNDQIFAKFQQGGETALSPDEYMKLAEILPAKYRADSYGSTTPEGTLALFIDALKKGDADLAAKYFVVEDQLRALQLYKGMAQDQVSSLVKYYETGPISLKKYGLTNSEDNISEISFPSNHTEYPFFFKLALNGYTKIWKLESL
jgi:hypothetical protein